MDGQGGQVHLQEGHVLDDQGVHPGFVEVPGLLARRLQLVVEEDGVERGEDLGAPEPGLPGDLLEVPQLIARPLPRPELGAAHVEGIRPAAKREDALFGVFGWGEEFEWHGIRVPGGKGRVGIGAFDAINGDGAFPGLR